MAEIAPDLTILGTFLRERRQTLGLTQHQLAERLGWQQERISTLERGRYGIPSLPLLARLAEALETPLAVLLEAAGYPVQTSAALSSGNGSDLAGGHGAAEGTLHQALYVTLQRLLAIQALDLKDALNQTSDITGRAGVAG